MAISANDKKVFHALVKLLPQDGSVQYIRNFNFNGFPFMVDRLLDLHEFEYRCKNDEEFKFDNLELENLKTALLGHILSFIEVANFETVSNSIGTREVPDNWQDSDPKRYESVTKRINDAAKGVCDTYDALEKLTAKA